MRGYTSDELIKWVLLLIKWGHPIPQYNGGLYPLDDSLATSLVQWIRRLSF
jgi:hypothetical protein